MRDPSRVVRRSPTESGIARVIEISRLLESRFLLLRAFYRRFACAHLQRITAARIKAIRAIRILNRNNMANKCINVNSDRRPDDIDWRDYLASASSFEFARMARLLNERDIASLSDSIIIIIITAECCVTATPARWTLDLAATRVTRLENET